MNQNEFVFHDGCLQPCDLEIEDGQAIEDAMSARGFVVESRYNDGETILYRNALTDDDIPCWVLMIGDTFSAALIRIVGWVDYFDAMRHFEPTIRLTDLADAEEEELASR